MNEIFRELNQDRTEAARAKFILYLKDQLVRLNGDMADAIKGAYEIAGLMATDFAQSIDSSDPIDEILTIAGELEVNPDNGEELRKELIEKIKQLK